jgi:hypothetical protein
MGLGPQQLRRIAGNPQMVNPPDSTSTVLVHRHELKVEGIVILHQHAISAAIVQCQFNIHRHGQGDCRARTNEQRPGEGVLQQDVPQLIGVWQSGKGR